MSPEQRQEWEDDEDALRRETAEAHAPAPESTESDERAARVERYAKAIFLSQDGWPIAWSDLHEDVQAGYLDEAKVAITLADYEHAALVAEIASLHRDALAEAQACRAMFARAQEAEGALLRVRALADAFADDGLARYGGNIAWHIEDVIANEKGDFPDAADQRIASQRERAEAAESKLTAVEALRARYEERAENGCPVSLNYARAHRDLTTALGGGE